MRWFINEAEKRTTLRNRYLRSQNPLPRASRNTTVLVDTSAAYFQNLSCHCCHFFDCEPDIKASLKKELCEDLGNEIRNKLKTDKENKFAKDLKEINEAKTRAQARLDTEAKTAAGKEERDRMREELKAELIPALKKELRPKIEKELEDQISFFERMREARKTSDD